MLSAGPPFADLSWVGQLPVAAKLLLPLRVRISRKPVPRSRLRSWANVLVLVRRIPWSTRLDTVSGATAAPTRERHFVYLVEPVIEVCKLLPAAARGADLAKRGAKHAVYSQRSCTVTSYSTSVPIQGHDITHQVRLRPIISHLRHFVY